jgi:predicted phosphodiesterase
MSPHAAGRRSPHRSLSPPGKLLLALQLIVAAPALAFAQNENAPFTVHDTRAVIMHGPYILAPTDTSATIVWETDTPSAPKVIYGIGDDLDLEAIAQKDGMVPVGKVQTVHLSGLEPGQTYHYRVVSTRVVKLNAYWPELGHPVESAVDSFTTFDTRKPTISFSVITDTHEDLKRIDTVMKMIDWPTTDFLVFTGDPVNWFQSADQLWSRWLDPFSKALGGTTPLIYARGNHEERGPFARHLPTYTPIEEGRFYYTRDDGPVHLLVIDTGEDKPDSTNVYARLNQMLPYREQELAWLEEHVRTSERLKTAPFRIVVMHQPDWGWVGGKNAEWTRVANDAGVDLAIAGHNHRFSFHPAGEDGRAYPLLVVGQDQVAHVDASATELKVVVRGQDGSIIKSFTVPKKERKVVP